MRHGGNHFLINRHFLFDCPLHSNQANPELVLEQLADGTDSPVPQLIDVINLANVLSKFQQVSNDSVKIGRFQDALLKRRRQIQFDVELQTADLGKVVFSGVEKHAFE